MQESAKYPKHFASKFCAGRALAQVIPSGVNTIIVFDTEHFDILSEYNNAVANAFQPNEAGYYFLHAAASIADLNAGDVLRVMFYLNGAFDIAWEERCAHALNEDVCANITSVWYLVPTDFVRVRVFHNFGANRNLSVSGYAGTRFCGFRVG